MARRRKPRGTKTSSSELDMLSSWLKKLRTAAKTRIVLTGNKRAAEKLKFLGVPNTYPATQFTEYKLIDLLEEFNRETIILFDTHAAANKRCERFIELLRQHKLKVNTRFRKALFTTEMRTVAGITTYLKKHVNTSQRKSVANTILQ